MADGTTGQNTLNGIALLRKREKKQQQQFRAKMDYMDYIYMCVFVLTHCTVFRIS